MTDPARGADPTGDGVRVADDDGVRTVTLDRPARLNAFTASSYRALASALDAAGADDTVRVVELVGAGRAFSSGVDLDALADAADQDEFRDAFAVLLRALTEFPKPLVAGVRGAAVGFGTTLLLHADVVLVADDARLRMPFAALGTAPEAASSVLLPAVVGPQRAAELLFTSRWIDASEAVRSGLAARRCATGDLPAELRSLTREIAAQPPAAVAAAKRLLRSGRAELVRAALQREDDAARALRSELGPLSRARAATSKRGVTDR
ncbi:MAG: enoyl-CoA hydratase [Blastococcus sp.]|nr:enoyl-CoA hydratase [Blastococcus sp.]